MLMPMTASREIVKKFKKVYKFHFVLLVTLIVVSCITYFVTGPLITLELVIGLVLIGLLASIIYLGSMLIELDNKVNQLETYIRKENNND